MVAIEVNTSLFVERLVKIFERLKSDRGLPEKLQVDNGPEFISLALADWAAENQVKPDLIQPVKTMQKSCIECFNRTNRDELLGLYLFRTLNEIRNNAEKMTNAIQHRTAR